jgi:hypothetical protein
MTPLPIASFKLRFADAHVRIVPARDAAGCPFAGPGVDVRGDDAQRVFALAAPILAWFTARDAVTVRSLSIDLVHRRILATVDAGGERPHVVKIEDRSDPTHASELVALAAPLLGHLGALAADRIARRTA